MSKPLITSVEFLITSSHIPYPSTYLVTPLAPFCQHLHPLLPASPVLFSPSHKRYVPPSHSLYSCPFLHMHNCVCFLVLTAFPCVSVLWELQNNSSGVTSMEHPWETWDVWVPLSEFFSPWFSINWNFLFPVRLWASSGPRTMTCPSPFVDMILCALQGFTECSGLI